MQYILVPMIDENWWAQLSEAEQKEKIAAYAGYGAALREAGVLLGAYRPQPSSAAKTVMASAGRLRIGDGPHAKTTEQPSGFYIIDVADTEAALSWAERCPATEYGLVEVRPTCGARG